MTEERFKKYIFELERGTSCTEFLENYNNVVLSLKKDPKSEKEYKTHKALSNKKRFLIYKLLIEKPMCTCALAKVFQISDGTISHHLKILEEAGLIIGKKESYFTRYFTVEKLIQTITSN
jgi:ArsR family transcriptional regulator